MFLAWLHVLADSGDWRRQAVIAGRRDNDLGKLGYQSFTMAAFERIEKILALYRVDDAYNRCAMIGAAFRKLEPTTRIAPAVSISATLQPSHGISGSLS